MIEEDQTKLWGAQTDLAIANFPVSDLVMPAEFIHALGLVKQAAAFVNQDLGLLDEQTALAIMAAAERVAGGEFDDQFPVDVFQTGSGTSSNMNANEVIAHLASQHFGAQGNVHVHPNDHVNLGQSSNDTIPTTLHISAVLMARDELLPALLLLAAAIRAKGDAHHSVIKTGRTHLMDAMPIRISQEFGAWATQIETGIERIESALSRCQYLAQGGTAVGTGINAHHEFASRFASKVSELTGYAFSASPDFFASLSVPDAAVELSGQLKVLAVSLMKIANDLRWMNSGPNAGLAEIELESLQAGSSIMPGKVNPVIPESVAQVCAQVIGNDSAITVGGHSGNFQLNVMWPMISYNLLMSLRLLTSAATLLRAKAIETLTINEKRLAEGVSRNPIVVTALNAVIGYEKGALIAKTAYEQGRPVIDVVQELTDLDRQMLERLLAPNRLVGD